MSHMILSDAMATFETSDLPSREWRMANLLQATRPVTGLVLNDIEGARIAAQAGTEFVLVGFSDGDPRGTPDEKSATIADHVAALQRVRAHNRVSVILADIPRRCYARGDDFLKVARLLMASGADGVKIEGGAERAEIVREIVQAGIPVVGHIGYTPKTGSRMRVRGRTPEDFRALFADAWAVVEAGASALVLELVDPVSAEFLTRRISVPTVGIYSGGGTSGQVLVLADVLGITEFDPISFPKGRPRSLGDWKGSPLERVSGFVGKVRAGEFPERVSPRPSDWEEMWRSGGAAHYY